MSPRGTDGVLASPGQLYTRWERQSWAVSELDLAGDAAGWGELHQSFRDQLREAIVGFFLGEAAVTATLAPLAHAAPTREDQIFLCTQLADEARHTVFFQSYLEAVEPGGGDFDAQLDGRRDAVAASQVELFDGRLRELTDAVRREPGRREAWYEAIAIYHLVVEGVLAITGQKTIMGIARNLGTLPALERGLRMVARDESRHVGFGLSALRDGVAEGHGKAIADAVTGSVAPLVRLLVHPERRAPRLRVPVAEGGRTLGPETLWEAARVRLLKRLHTIGLDAAAEAAEAEWLRAARAALDDYEARHSHPHPAREAALAASC